MPTLAPPPPAPPKAAASAKLDLPPIGKADGGNPTTDVIDAPKESDDPFKDAFADIDKVAGEETDRETRRNTKPKPDDSETLEDSEKAKVNGDAKPKVEKPADDEPKTPKELREVYKALKEKVAKEYEPQVKELPRLKAKIAELESRDESATRATQDEIAAVKKRNAELEQHIRFVDFEKSKDYQEQFQKPYEDAWANALRDLKGLTMAVEDPKTGEEVRREVTQADIAYFANLEPAARRQEINRLFPEDKEEVKRHINYISTLAEKAHAAKERAKSDAETHAKTQTEAQRQAQSRREKLWKETNKALAEKYPKWFAHDEADAEGNAVFDKGAALADLVFSPQDLTPERVALLPKAFKEAIESAKPFPPELIVRLQAIARNKLANHDRAITKLKAANARIAELEKSLKEYEDSGPDAVRVGGARRVKDQPLTADEEFDALARGN